MKSRQENLSIDQLMFVQTNNEELLKIIKNIRNVCSTGFGNILLSLIKLDID